MECLILSLTSSWFLTRMYGREMESIRQKQVDEIMKTVNDSINVYFKRMNLLFYVLQNNSSVKKILRKEEYQNNQELFQDMETMKEILKNAMIGEEYIRNIALVSEKGFYFSGGGSEVESSRSGLKQYQKACEDKEIGIIVEAAEDHYGYAKLKFIKKIQVTEQAPEFCALNLAFQDCFVPAEQIYVPRNDTRSVSPCAGTFCRSECGDNLRNHSVRQKLFLIHVI